MVTYHVCFMFFVFFFFFFCCWFDLVLFFVFFFVREVRMGGVLELLVSLLVVCML